MPKEKLETIEQDGVEKVIIPRSDLESLIERVAKIEKGQKEKDRDLLIEKKKPEIAFLRFIEGKYVIAIIKSSYSNLLDERGTEKMMMRMFDPMTKKTSELELDYKTIIERTTRKEVRIKNIETSIEVEDLGTVEVIEREENGIGRATGMKIANEVIHQIRKFILELPEGVDVMVYEEAINF